MPPIMPDVVVAALPVANAHHCCCHHCCMSMFTAAAIITVTAAGVTVSAGVVIFTESPTLCDKRFIEAVKGCTMQLLNFGDAIAICRCSSEKIFCILGMYEALSGMMLELRSMLPVEHGELLLTEAEEILTRLGDTTKGTFNEFGNDGQNENSKKTMPNSGVLYVMNNHVLLVSYKDSLGFLLDGNSLDDRNHPEGIEQRDGNGGFGLVSPTARRLLACISYLEANLEEKKSKF
ncbi:exocyst complex component EXO70B2-like [Dioscorea cayenensis subsp. rotundata]|uniref:Exocyst subunit Exo70 family protein n=1 Tax=Dioscorea cayennensis subsp. rotundata TaxID=55577 RepID=A0AB40BTU9_DIOCR|nr:exocyst complex component EXO70B2-like [Dioscorea cayenensis subsp. rotundata]